MIELRDIAIRAGEFELEHVDLKIPPGAYAFLIGKTGAGKTTILEAICGLRRSHKGTIIVNGRDVTRLKPAERGIGYVPQDGALFPTMTVEEHLAFALEIRKWNPTDISQRVAELADSLGIDHLLHRYPKGLSGGEKQRVGLGRALSFKPEALCLDEPLSALDPDSRGEIVALLDRIKAETGLTALHITHNYQEAVKLADRVFQLKDRRLQAVENFALPTPSRIEPA